MPLGHSKATESGYHGLTTSVKKLQTIETEETDHLELFFKRFTLIIRRTSHRTPKLLSRLGLRVGLLSLVNLY